MKRLQDFEEKRWQFHSLAQLDGVIRTPNEPKEVILLLHGLNERGRRIYRKLLPYLPENALIISPNGPFPLPRYKEEKLDFGYAWYFWDKFTKNYIVNQDLAKNWLKELVSQNNREHLPVTIIGFSQGGYLAPLAGLIIPETKLVIGLGCEFRSALITEIAPFPLVGIHGEQDDIVSAQSSRNEFELLKERGFSGEWHGIEGKHEINQAIGFKVKEMLDKYGKTSL